MSSTLHAQMSHLCACAQGEFWKVAAPGVYTVSASVKGGQSSRKVGTTNFYVYVFVNLPILLYSSDESAWNCSILGISKLFGATVLSRFVTAKSLQQFVLEYQLC